ncbi:hypothetical protein [Kurthia senegalensis]|uniref:hypothetical protein n=1 Tax=Kurthia senegalensis TaxID=1033740 RepID=UPI0012B60B2C|nr:hypothetical protein [Kurthia senegalensis]
MIGKKYSYETKMKVMKRKLAQVPVKEMMNVCGIKNDRQLYQCHAPGKRSSHSA